MKNKLGDLNDHLFAQLERLADEDLSADEMEQEVKRADAIVKVSDQIVANAGTQLRAAKLFAVHGDRVAPMLPLVGRSDSAKLIEQEKTNAEG